MCVCVWCVRTRMCVCGVIVCIFVYVCELYVWCVCMWCVSVCMCFMYVMC
jgi:hypothetical protein